MRMFICLAPLILVVACESGSNPSPYATRHAPGSDVVLRLPTLTATSVSLSTSERRLSERLAANARVDIEVIFRSLDERDIPPVVVLYWRRPSEGQKRGPSIQQRSGAVTKEGNEGNVSISTVTPRLPGEYQIEVLCPSDDTQRRALFDVTVAR